MIKLATILDSLRCNLRQSPGFLGFFLFRLHLYKLFVKLLVHGGELAQTSRAVSPTCSGLSPSASSSPSLYRLLLFGMCESFSGCPFPKEDFLELRKVLGPGAALSFCSPVRGIDLHVFARPGAATCVCAHTCPSCRSFGPLTFSLLPFFAGCWFFTVTLLIRLPFVPVSRRDRSHPP